MFYGIGLIFEFLFIDIHTDTSSVEGLLDKMVEGARAMHVLI